jgi:hypothetical protein
MKKKIIVLSGILIGFLMSCNVVGSSVTLFDESAVPPDVQFQTDEYNLIDEVWPFFLPDEIPQLPGVIDTIIADSQTMRITFHDMPQEAFEAYLASYENQGYNLQYLLYADESNSEENLNKKYDAVELIKENISIRLEYENNAGNMDINIGQLGIKVKQGPGWPAVLQGISPEATCKVETLYMQTDGTINIMCLTQDGDFLANYTNQLSNAGFNVVYQFTDQENKVYQIELAKGKMMVEIRTYNAKKTGITVRNYQ